MSFLEAKNKPDDWPVNGKEVILENIYVSLNNFIENPGYKTKEIIVSLVSAYDLSQQSYERIYRVSDFEVRLINTIFIKATQCNLNAVKTYIYTIISDTVRLQKSMSFVSEVLKEKSDIRIIPYEEGLLYPLKLYYFAYQRFSYEKDIGFAENIVFVMSEAISDAKDDQKLLSFITSAYMAMMNDISYMSGNKRDDLWKFDREELKSLFTIEAKLIKKCSLDINKRPIKGVLLTQFSNYILKSRDGYNDEFICKYIPADAAVSAT